MAGHDLQYRLCALPFHCETTTLWEATKKRLKQVGCFFLFFGVMGEYKNKDL